MRSPPSFHFAITIITPVVMCAVVVIFVVAVSQPLTQQPPSLPVSYQLPSQPTRLPAVNQPASHAAVVIACVAFLECLPKPFFFCFYPREGGYL